MKIQAGTFEASPRFGSSLQLSSDLFRQGQGIAMPRKPGDFCLEEKVFKTSKLQVRPLTF